MKNNYCKNTITKLAAMSRLTLFLRLLTDEVWLVDKIYQLRNINNNKVNRDNLYN